MPLNPAQMRQLYHDGYTIAPGAVPRHMVEAARRAINRHIGNEGIPPERLTEFRALSYCRELQGEPVITDLFNQTPAFELLESAMGEGLLQRTGGGQIALRFPNTNDPEKPPNGHLDGVGTGDNGTPVGEFIRTFSALAVVLLSDLPRPTSGNFVVWPGSHFTLETYFKQATPDILKQGQPRVDLPNPPVQITGSAGDVVFAHHQLIHAAAPNASPDIRYAAIFRAKHVEVNAITTDAMTDIWREWPALREAVAD